MDPRVRAAPLFLIGLTLARAVETARWSQGTARLVGLGGWAALLVNVAVAGPDLISLPAICVVVLAAAP